MTILFLQVICEKWVMRLFLFREFSRFPFLYGSIIFQSCQSLGVVMHFLQDCSTRLKIPKQVFSIFHKSDKLDNLYFYRMYVHICKFFSSFLLPYSFFQYFHFAPLSSTSSFLYSAILRIRFSGRGLS